MNDPIVCDGAHGGLPAATQHSCITFLLLSCCCLLLLAVVYRR